MESARGPCSGQALRGLGAHSMQTGWAGGKSETVPSRLPRRCNLERSPRQSKGPVCGLSIPDVTLSQLCWTQPQPPGLLPGHWAGLSPQEQTCPPRALGRVFQGKADPVVGTSETQPLRCLASSPPRRGAPQAELCPPGSSVEAPPPAPQNVATDRAFTGTPHGLGSWGQGEMRPLGVMAEDPGGQDRGCRGSQPHPDLHLVLHLELQPPGVGAAKCPGLPGCPHFHLVA